jgi:hypothetical protein
VDFKQNLVIQLQHSLGKEIAETEITAYIQQIEIIEPQPGQLFWHTTDSAAGIFVILTGKVRVLNVAENQVLLLPPGSTIL